jgi:flagellar motor switch protein FliG
MSEVNAQAAAPGGVEKTAVLLLAMGPEFATKTLRGMPDEKMRAVLAAMGKLKVISLGDQQRVLEEFRGACQTGDDGLVVGPENIEKFMREAVGREQSRKLLSGMGEDDGFAVLRQAAPKSLADLLSEEHPQTVAVAVSQFDSEKAAGVLEALPEGLRLEVCRRIGHMRVVPRDVVLEVGRSLTQALQAKPKDAKPASASGSELLGDIMSLFPQKLSVLLLASLREQEPELVQQLEKCMVVFDDVLRMENKTIQKLLSQVDQKSLGMALKGGSQEITAKFFANMTKESSEALMEDMESLGAIKPADVDAARQKFVKAMSKMLKGGEAALGPSTKAGGAA